MANPIAAVFPAAVADDSVLVPVTSSYQSILVGDVDNSQTSIPVSTILNGFDANVILPIILRVDNELIYAPTRSGNTFTGCTRGMFESVPAAHAASAAVYGNVSGTILNQLFAEVKSLESTLGANLANMPGRSRAVAAGNFTVPAGVSSMRITVIGAGGGGAGATTNTGGGGGGGGQVLELLVTTTPGAVITCTYGAAGTAGAINTAGGDGGDTSISGAGITGNTFTALGGKGGSNSGAGGNSGGGTAGGAFGSTRPLYDQGGAGGGGRNAANQASIPGSGPNSYLIAGAAASVYRGGGGAGCIWGFPGQVSPSISGGAQSTMNAIVGFGYGVGGAGGCYDAGTAGAGTGSIGGAGLILFEWE